MKKKIFALLLAFCVVFTMMPAMALAAETAENDADKNPTIGLYKDSEGTEKIDDNVIKELDTFYLLADYIPADGEIVDFYGNGPVVGMVMSDRAFNSKGQPYTKITLPGKFDSLNYRFTLWRDPSAQYEEEELCGIDLTIIKSTSSLTAAEAKTAAKDLLRALELDVRASKTAKGLKVKADAPDSSLKSLKNLGFKVKYEFLRSTSKAKNYKVKAAKAGKTYLDTSAKKGTKYYYKCKVAVYDAQGKLVAKTALSQSKYAAKKR